MICQRCSKETNAHTMSWFNTDIICMSCAEAEKKEPGFEEAKRAEHEAVRGGDYNFRGVRESE
jgi:hypothetical protein